MKNARGICPTCLRERGLTPQRQAITAHKVDGVACEGSGSQPSEITRLADADYTATCPACHYVVRLYGGRRLAAHNTKGKPCEMSGADLRAEVLPEPSETPPESNQLDFPPLETNTDSQATCPTCQTTVSRQWGRLAEHDANGKRCSMSGADLRDGLFLKPPGTAHESGQPNPGSTSASRQPTHRDWVVFTAISLLVLGALGSCVVGNNHDASRMDRAVAYTCQVWVKAAKEHPGELSVMAPDSTGLDQSEIDKRVEAQCGDSKRAWEDWAASQSTAPSPTTESPSAATSPDQADCEQRIAAMMGLAIDEQSKADNIDSIRIDCNMPPLQSSPFWQEAWRIHLEKTGQTP
jgi:hypothetical protein